jgi:hypothetical protein
MHICKNIWAGVTSNPLTRPPLSLIHQASPLILFRVYTYVYTGNPFPNLSTIGVPKGVLIDIWGEKWVKVLHKLKFYMHLN